MSWSTCDLADEHGDAVRVLPTALRHFGRVLVVEGSGSLRCAPLGDTIAAEAPAHGWSGVVVWGCVRDTAALAELDLGVVPLASNPRRSRKDGDGETNVQLEIEGVAWSAGRRPPRRRGRGRPARRSTGHVIDC